MANLQIEQDDTTIFSSDMTAAERAAVRSGEERGKKAYMKDHPRCGTNKTTEVYRRNYVRIFGHE